MIEMKRDLNVVEEGILVETRHDHDRTSLEETVGLVVRSHSRSKVKGKVFEKEVDLKLRMRVSP